MLEKKEINRIIREMIDGIENRYDYDFCRGYVEMAYLCGAITETALWEFLGRITGWLEKHPEYDTRKF